MAKAKTTTKAASAGPAIVSGIIGVSSVAKANISSIDGILNGKKWSSSTLTYSFPTIASTYEYSGEPGKNFQAFNDAQKAAIRSVLAEYSAVANLHFVEVTESSTNHATLRFAESDAVSTAYTYYPAATAQAGDVWFNKSTGWYNNPVAGNYAYLTMLHEVGHALGLKHAQDTTVYGAMPTSLSAMPYTVMSYQSYVGAPITGNYTNQSASYAQTLMSSDILAIQKIYGANYATNAGNTVYSWTPNSGSTFVNGVAEETTAGNKIFHTIWDGGGNDTYDFSAYNTGVVIDLNPGAWSTASQAQLANLSGNGQQMAPGNIANAYLFNKNTASLIENATGGSGNDTIVGNSVANTLSGRNGNDTLNGGAGADHMWGGSGSDTYIVDNSGDVVDETGGTGIDNVQSSITFSLSDVIHAVGAVENLTLTGSAALKATGNTFNNTLIGNSGANTLTGLGGDDTLNGAGGNDRLVGGAGHDFLTGGAGKDTFVFSAFSDIGDTISDFKHSEDHIEISRAGFNLSLKTGPLAASYFDANGTATHAGPEFVYDKVNHTLLFDSDGKGACQAIEIAHLTNVASLVASDIWIA